MKAHKPRKSFGRVTFDPRGNATWEWRDATGTLPPAVDTQRLKSLGADLSFEGAPESNDALSHDPYNRSSLPRSSELRPRRRSLDDLRRLSEEIKAARTKEDPKR